MSVHREAVWTECPGIRNEGLANHFMRDNCGSCAPWWEFYPACPECGRKYSKATYGEVVCVGCKEPFVINARERE